MAFSLCRGCRLISIVWALYLYEQTFCRQEKAVAERNVPLFFYSVFFASRLYIEYDQGDNEDLAHDFFHNHRF